MTATLSPAPTVALPRFDDAAAWYGPAMARRSDWLVELDAAELAELDAAVDAALRRGQDLVTMSERDFPLPRLAPRLKSIRHDILHGRGFVLLRG